MLDIDNDLSHLDWTDEDDRIPFEVYAEWALQLMFMLVLSIVVLVRFDTVAGVLAVILSGSFGWRSFPMIEDD